MNPETPAELRLGRQALTLLEAVLVAAAPEEGCALLLGGRDPWCVRRVWPCLNVWEPAAERRRRFALDPREQLLAQKWARSRGLSVLGSAHSHPLSEPVPSALDRSMAFAPTLMLILGQADRPATAAAAGATSRELACWWLPEQGSPRRLAWRMDD
ncbi:M67 family metallopeptidase [Cyanobium gracile]|uniref:M67 family metallopeptidase n=1 Tax=Cyanobium gracile UHCC 0281 TaxID=3110309 RepID=A0ABU5SXP1_9CYAN|nr:M67 family metallopeptidase [Cyanobium gracile]MEA5443251.1 M67 family metallopeptidase [Cyanobium gracile UHCC 0281]